ncbi:MAG: GLPGLI family protein [Flavobacteriaceae bacterium]|nr:GLPGLI family protein [Flavobacteriaceae bacterium]
MKSISIVLLSVVLMFVLSSHRSYENYYQEFKGEAIYVSKSKMELGKWGSTLPEARKKEIANRLKNRLNKTYVLTFNREASMFKEDERLDAISGATDSWGAYFTPGDQYKNVKTKTQVQDQEFYGKRFLVKDNLQPIQWQMGNESKTIGKYNCFKAMALIPTEELKWYDFSWSQLRNSEKKAEENQEDKIIDMTQVEAWYTPQIPVSHGPLEYWGLPGLILEVSTGNTTLLCSKITVNPKETIEIEAPRRGTQVTKKEYKNIVFDKMKMFRASRTGRSH